MRKTLLCLLSMMIANAMNAQIQCPECQGLLNPLLMSKYQLQVDNSNSQAFEKALRLTDDQLRQIENGSSSDFGASIPIPIVKAILSIGSSSTEYSKQLETIRKSFRSDESKRITSDEQTWLYTTSIHDDIPSAFNQCMQTCLDQSREFRIQIIGDEKKEFGIVVNYSTSRQGRPSSVTLNDLSLSSNLQKVSSDNMNSGAVLNNGSSLSQMFKRTDNNTATIVVNIQGEAGLSAILQEFDISSRVPPRHEIIVPQPPPVFLAYESPGDPVNTLTLSARTSCDGCSESHDDTNGWAPNKSVNAGSSWHGHLDASSQSTGSVSVSKAGNLSKINLTGNFRSHAGWGDKPSGQSPYRPANSSLKIQGATGFKVPERCEWCLMIQELRLNGGRQKRADGSYLFQNKYPSWPMNIITLKDPNGNDINLQSGTILPLNVAGTWKIVIDGNFDFYSGWSEDSGQFDFNEDFSFKFIKKYQDGTCPGM